MARDKHYFTVEFEETTPFDDVQQGTMHQALNYVDEFKRLGDPSYVPIAIIHHTVTQNHEQQRIPLNSDFDPLKVLVEVQNRLHDIVAADPKADVLTGPKAIEFIVNQTIEVMNGSTP